MTHRSAGACLLSALLALTALPSSSQELSLPDNPLAGRLLFESRHCVLCHGTADDTPGVGPDLAHGAFSGSFLDFGAALWNHVPGMSVSFTDAGLPWPELTQREVTELVSFVYFIDYLGRPGSVRTGRTLFRTKSCDECHALGTGGSAPDLAGLERFASPLYMAQAIWNHGPSMFETMRAAGMRLPTFAEGDLADLSAFVRQAGRATGPRQRMLLSPGNPNHGQELFRDRGCSFCHGSDATGGEWGPDLTRADLHRSAEGIAASMWNHASVMSDMMSRRGLGWPQFTTVELADLIAFLYFLPFRDAPGDPGRGESVFASRSCADCHEATEMSAHAGPDLRGAGIGESPASFVAAMWSHAPVMKEAILAEGSPWPELSGDDLRDLLAFLRRPAD